MWRRGLDMSRRKGFTKGENAAGDPLRGARGMGKKGGKKAVSPAGPAGEGRGAFDGTVLPQ